MQSRQSPIDIPNIKQIEYEPRFQLRIDYKPVSDVQLVDLEHTLKLSCKNIGQITLTDLDGKGPFTY